MPNAVLVASDSEFQGKTRVAENWDEHDGGDASCGGPPVNKKLFCKVVDQR